MQAYLGIDVGAITTKAVAIDEAGDILARSYLRNRGRVAESLERVLGEVHEALGAGIHIAGKATTGSGRHLAAQFVQPEIVRNEITTHALGATRLVPQVHTILEMGGQDSALIVLRDGLVADFATNTVCAAGTGSFLDHQAERLGVSVEQFGELARRSRTPVHISGRCTVFAETEMIHLQQAGVPIEDIAAGLCEAIVRNFLSGLARRLQVKAPIVFQGGVAGNVGVRDAFERALGVEVIVPPHHEVVAALGAALLVRQHVRGHRKDEHKASQPGMPRPPRNNASQPSGGPS